MIPAFNVSGVLPPYCGADPANPSQVSPYEVSMSEFADHFGTSTERIAILKGLLDYRARLLQAGITSGFQLIDGSYVEDCETIRKRAPADVDLVTFAHLPVLPKELNAFLVANRTLFDPQQAKAIYKCDAYFVDLGKDARLVVEDTMYWFGLFSHQRVSNLWKGMIRIPLLSDDSSVVVA